MAYVAMAVVVSIISGCGVSIHICVVETSTILLNIEFLIPIFSLRLPP